LEALFFGRHFGLTIIKDLDSGNIELRPATEADAQTMIDEIETIMTSNGTETVPGLRNELQQSMTDNAGVFRTQETLEKQLEIMKDLRARFNNIRIDDKSKIFNTDLQEAIELGHMLDFSLFIVNGALERKESRGAHFREDYPTRDDENFHKHSMQYMDKDGNVTMDYLDVIPGKFELQERTY
jgi:succinate dehydrogenase / fumarate reductase flavoprotein subunit